MNTSEHDMNRAIERMNANDTTLRHIVLTQPGLTRFSYSFDHALTDTTSPIQSLTLHSCDFWNYIPVHIAFSNMKAPIRKLHLCQCMNGALNSSEISWFLSQLPNSVRHIVIHDATLSDRNIAMFLKISRTTPEEEAVLYAIGQYAANILRPLLHVQVECVRTIECMCGQH